MIDSDAFVHRLNRTKAIPVKLSNALMEGIRLNRYGAQETFVSPGNYSSSIYYIQSGIIRGAIEGPEEKISTWFKQEGDIVIPQGLFNQQPSEEYINAVTKATLIALPFKNLKNVADAFPDVMELIVLLTMEKISEGQYREKLLRTAKAKDRYDLFMKNEKYLLKRIAHFIIASYLNVTKETFSHLYKGLPY